MNNFKLSKQKELHLEISVQVGCGRMCDYCPQTEYIQRYSELFLKKDKLTFDYFLSIVDNIPPETVIHWTGFTEPMDCLDFSLIAQKLHELGYKQLISTTLYGKSNSQSFFVNNLKVFNGGISLHLPDNSGLMKGKFDTKYIDYVDSVLQELIQFEDIDYSLFLIGDQFHVDIQSLIDKYKQKIPSKRIIKAKYLNTRNNSVDPKKYNLLGSESKKTTGSTFYCSYRRLNHGVLLPNGRISICSNDYNLDMLLGSLEDSSLEEIYNVIEGNEEMKNDFITGKFYPCVKCEHYKSIDQKTTTNRD
jgi:hypothetical protein